MLPYLISRDTTPFCPFRRLPITTKKKNLRSKSEYLALFHLYSAMIQPVSVNMFLYSQPMKELNQPHVCGNYHSNKEMYLLALKLFPLLINRHIPDVHLYYFLLTK